MPTGTALRDARAQLFAAADRILVREGAGALTSRAVTTESGVAKGVLHRHFPDFETFLVEYVLDHVAQLTVIANRLLASVGEHTVSSNVTDAMIDAFTPATVAVVSLVLSRDGLRTRLRPTTPQGIPLLAELTAAITAYLRRETEQARLLCSADPAALALNLVGTAHLLFAGELGAVPDQAAIDEVVTTILVGAERSPST